MRSSWILLALVCLVACGAPGNEEAGTLEPERPAASAPDEDTDDEGEEQESPELPPKGALPLSAVAVALEAAGHVPVLEIELEGDVWDVDFLRDGAEWEATVDPLSGEILSVRSEAETEAAEETETGEPEDEEDEAAAEPPPEGALPLSGVLTFVETKQCVPVFEVELEEGVWDIDCLREGEPWELEIDPLTGEILASGPE